MHSFIPITIIYKYASFFNCKPVDRASDSMNLFKLVGSGASCLLLGLSSTGIGWGRGWGRSFCRLVGQPGFNWCFYFAPGFSKLFGAQGSPSSGSLLNLLSPRF